MIFFQTCVKPAQAFICAPFVSAENYKAEAQLGLVLSAENGLAPRKERFRTVSSSCISAFAKAIHFGQCSSELPELRLEALRMRFKDDEFATLVRYGPGE